MLEPPSRPVVVFKSIWLLGGQVKENDNEPCKSDVHGKWRHSIGHWEGGVSMGRRWGRNVEIELCFWVSHNEVCTYLFLAGLCRCGDLVS